MNDNIIIKLIIPYGIKAKYFFSFFESRITLLLFFSYAFLNDVLFSIGEVEYFNIPGCGSSINKRCCSCWWLLLLLYIYPKLSFVWLLYLTGGKREKMNIYIDDGTENKTKENMFVINKSSALTLCLHQHVHTH